MTKKLIKMISIVLTLCMIFSITVFAEETIKNMSYEEYIQLQNELAGVVTAESDMQPVILEHNKNEDTVFSHTAKYESEEIKELELILSTKGIFALDREIDQTNIANSITVETKSEEAALGVQKKKEEINAATESTVSDNDMPSSVIESDGAVFAAPVAGLVPIFINEESLVNGNISTDTLIAFLYNDTDPDGHAIVNRYVGGSAADFILGEIDGGFVIQVTEPGSYELLYQVEDSNGEFSSVIGFTFNVVNAVSESGYQVFEGNFAAATDTTTYHFSIDFSKMDSAAVCLIRKGYVGTTIQVYNESGERVVYRSTQMGQPKNWEFINKPSADAGICNYTIVATPNSYTNRASDYRIVVGDKNETELMMSGIENTVLLEQYYEESSRVENAYYLPNKGEYWYKYRAGIPSVITVLNNAGNLRFKIIAMDGITTMFDSIKASDTHRTTYTGSGVWTCAEKAKLTTTVGQEYYLVVYCTSPDESLSLRTGNMGTAVGNPVMLAGSTTASPGQRVTMSSSGFSSAMVFNMEFPRTGQVIDMNLRGVAMSNVDRWRLQAPNQSFWVNNEGTCHPTVNMNYKHDSDLNASLLGPWRTSFKATTSASVTTFMPSFSIRYYCEYGD